MPGKVNVNEVLGISKVESCGVVSEADIAESIRQVRQILEEKGKSKILADTTKQETMPSTLGIYRLFSTFSRELRLAFLLSQDRVAANDISFAETTTVNRGIRVKIFHKDKQAANWLNDQYLSNKQMQ